MAISAQEVAAESEPIGSSRGSLRRSSTGMTESSSSGSGRSRRSRTGLHSRGAALACAALLVLVCLAPSSGFVRPAAAQEAGGEAACPTCPECAECADCSVFERAAAEIRGQVQGLESQLSAKDAALSGAQSKVEALEKALAEAKEAEASLEKGLAAAAGKLAGTIGELKASKQALSDLEAQLLEAQQQGGEICLPAAASGAILGAWAQAKPHLDTAHEVVSKHVSHAAAVGGDLAQQSLAKGKVVAAEASRVAQTHLAAAAAEAKRHAAPVLEQVDAAAKPYYQPAVEKLDEVTKPYQPKAVEVWGVVRSKCVEAVAYVHSLDLCCKYKDLAKMAAGKLISLCSGVPVLSDWIHPGNEATIVNTLLWAPTATVAYVVLFGGSKKKNKGKKNKGKKNKAANNMASPGKPAFKPSGSPFRPTPRKH